MASAVYISIYIKWAMDLENFVQGQYTLEGILWVKYQLGWAKGRENMPPMSDTGHTEGHIDTLMTMRGLFIKVQYYCDKMKI